MRKRTIIATISLFVLASCNSGPTEGPKTAAKDASKVTAISADQILGRPGQSVLSYNIGPFNLPASTPAGNMLARPVGFQFNVGESTWIKTFEPSVVDSEGNTLPKQLVHQIVLVNHGEENSSCTTKQTGNPFAAATSSLQKIELPEGYGYLANPADQLEANVVLKNPTTQDYNGVFVKFVLTGQSASQVKNINDVRPLMIDVDPCDHMPISIPPGQFAEKTQSATVPETGTMIKAYGLLANYGVSVTLTDGDQGKTLWQGVAEIDDKYQITGLPPFEDAAGVQLKQGGSLGLTVAYNNSSDTWFDEATGAAMIYLARGDEKTAAATPATTPPATDTKQDEKKSVSAASAQQKLF